MSPGATPPSDLEVLAAWAPELAQTFVALSCDIALVLDAGGGIAQLAQHASHPIAPDTWVGMAWTATAAEDSRVKIEQMLDEVAASGQARRREINHPDALGGPVAVAYSAVRLGAQGPTLAIGHDLRTQMALQQRFVAAQEALERSYWHAQQRTRRGAAGGDDPGGAPPRMTDKERASLGLDASGEDEAEGAELLHALGRLYERIGHDALPHLLRDARRLAERHFLQQALARAGSVEALARSLGVSPRALAKRSGAPVKPSSRRRFNRPS
ncbi:MAG TPA: hypothetical protein VM845_00095 [Burkholderiaceae bacterium]|jgi:hypothetical protein|nr:hypothetical protein [Burkholderiaceae bacterium]